MKMRLGTSLKVAFGYIVLISLLLGSIVYIYDTLKQLERSEKAEQMITERRRAVNLVVSRLYEAEIMAQIVGIGKIADSSEYHEAMQRASDAIDSLRVVFTDEDQRMRLDTLKNLLTQKEKNMRSLMLLMNDSKDQVIYKTQIRKMIQEQDTVVRRPQIQKKVVTNNQTYVVTQKKKKRFFQRLAEVFSPSEEEDSTTVNKVVSEVILDTVQHEAYNAADTLVNILQRAEDSLQIARSRKVDLIRNRLREQQTAGALLSMKVTQMLETIEQEEQELLNRRMKQESDIRQKAVMTLVSLTVAAILLAMAFSIIVWRDITQSNHYRKELEKAKNRAEELLQVRENLMLTITHDIKAPVGSILGYIDLLSRLLKEKRSLFYLENMRSSAQHLLNLVTSLLDFHRLDANKMDIQQVAYNPKQLFETLYNCFLPLAQKKKLQFDCSLDDSLNGSYYGDPFRIRQITDNLLSNALKFTEKGKIELRVTVEQEMMHIAVSDTGCGITSEEQTQIFKAFARLSSAQGQEGFGLGLSITQKLVGLLGGKINIASHVGRGTTFHIYLPLSKAAETVDAMVDRPHLQRSLKIIMIDDDRIQLQLNRAMIETVWGEYKPELTCCHTPEELMESLRQNDYDLLLTDIQMPEMNGFDLLRNVRQLKDTCGEDIPVVAITARSDMSEKDFIDHGFAARLNKPFSQQDLVRAIEMAIGMKIDVHLDEPLQNHTSPSEEPDFKALLAFADGDREASLQILQTFVGEGRGHLERLAAALKEEQIKEAAEVAHKMLPTYTLIGTKKVTEHLKALERKRNETVMSPEDKEHLEEIIKYVECVLEKGNERIAQL